ncbi:MAG: ugpB, partial [Proteobacteria bacterium]|nr:ugpB [Pseudomonadota bacterium]
MKMIQALTAFIVAATFLGTGTAQAAAPKKPAATKKAPAKAAAAKPAPAPDVPAAEIELVHQLGIDKGEQLKHLVERFNATSGQKIVVSERDWQQGDLPHMMILAEDGEAQFLAGKPRYKPLYQLMKETGEPLQTFKERPGVMSP